MRLSESVNWNEWRFALIPGNIEIVKTDLPQNQGISTGKPVLQAEVQFRINTRVVKLIA